MDSPGDGWDADILRAYSACLGSFCTLVQGVSALADRLSPYGSDPSPSSSTASSPITPSPEMNGPSRLLQLVGPMSVASRTALPSGLYRAARRWGGHRGFWVGAGAVGMAAAASLSAASAANSAELPTSSDTTARNGVGTEANEPSRKNGNGRDGFLDGMVDERARGLSSACMSVLHGTSKGGVVEPRTKVRFPLLLCENGTAESSDSGDQCQVLAGVGVRSKSIIKLKTIKVYAFGLYVRAEKVRAELGEKYGRVPTDELKNREDFYEDLLSKELGMTVRLVVHYKGLSMEMVRSAFVTSLGNRLQKIRGGDQSEDSALKTFSSYFSQPLDISRGTTIDFQWQPGGRLITEIGGRKMEPIVSPHLCRAFFDLYIGEPPVCEIAKQEIGESCARMLSAC